SGGGGTDYLMFADGGSSISLTLTDVEEVRGGSGNDVITIVSKNNGLTIKGHAGNDRITAGTGTDRIDGGDGNETYVYASATDSSIVNKAATASGFDVVTVTAGDVFDFNVEVASVTSGQVYIADAPKENGDELLAQLNNAFLGAAVLDDGIDAMFI